MPPSSGEQWPNLLGFGELYREVCLTKSSVEILFFYIVARSLVGKYAFIEDWLISRLILPPLGGIGSIFF